MKRLRNKRVSQSDVAKAANVSQSVVSVVFSSSPARLVNAQTRQRVLDIAKKLDYKPRFMASNEWGRPKTKSVAWINLENSIPVNEIRQVISSYESFYSIPMRSALHQLEEGGYSMIVKNRCAGDNLKEWLSTHHVEGMILRGNPYEPLAWLTEDFPVVTLRSISGKFDHVGINQEENITLALDYAMRLGHKQIAYFGNPPGHELFDCRERTYRRFMHEYGLRDYTEFTCIPDSSDVSSAAKAAQIADVWLALDPADRPTLIILSDWHALHLIRELQRRKIKIPHDLSLIGIDNIPAAEFSHPRLTAIDQSLSEIGRSAAELLLSRIAEPKRKPRGVLVSPELVERDSVKDLTRPATELPLAAFASLSARK